VGFGCAPSSSFITIPESVRARNTNGDSEAVLPGQREAPRTGLFRISLAMTGPSSADMRSANTRTGTRSAAPGRTDPPCAPPTPSAASQQRRPVLGGSNISRLVRRTASCGNSRTPRKSELTFGWPAYLTRNSRNCRLHVTAFRESRSDPTCEVTNAGAEWVCWGGQPLWRTHMSDGGRFSPSAILSTGHRSTPCGQRPWPVTHYPACALRCSKFEFKRRKLL